MCVTCEQAYKAIKVCRGHTVKAVKDIVKISQSKLAPCVNQWKAKKTQINTKAREIDTSVKRRQVQA